MQETFLSISLSATEPFDELVTFLKVPLTTTPEAVALVARASTVFKAPSLDTLAKYAEHKNRCFSLLTQILSVEEYITVINDLIKFTPPSTDAPHYLL